MLITKAPLRVSLFGGGTDYPDYIHLGNEGSVVGGTIDKSIYVQSLPLSAGAEQKIRFNYRTTESVTDIDDIQHPVLREVLKYVGFQKTLNLSTMSDLPGGTGLGSSSAFTVGLLNHIYTLMDRQITKSEVAKQAVFIERELLQEKVGLQDQHHAAFGGFNRLIFKQNMTVIEPINISMTRLSELNNSCLLIYTGSVRSAAAVLKSQNERTSKGDNDEYLKKMYDLTTSAKDVFESECISDSACIKEIGSMLDASWKLKRSLSEAVSTAIVDQIISTCMAAGAYGCKLLGAGGAGFVLTLANESTIRTIEKEFGFGKCVRFKFVNDCTRTSILNM